jgi:hypothetical protein
MAGSGASPLPAMKTIAYSTMPTASEFMPIDPQIPLTSQLLIKLSPLGNSILTFAHHSSEGDVSCRGTSRRLR